MVNVLIADDNIYYAKLLMDLINDEEVRVCNIAITGKEALNIIQKSNNIDVILLNLKMPIYNRNGDNGYSFKEGQKGI